MGRGEFVRHDPKWAATGLEGRLLRDFAKIERAFVSLNASVADLNWSVRGFVAAWLTSEAIEAAAVQTKERDP